MASPSVTYTFSNSTTADATQVNQNFTDIINGLTDGTKDLSISALTCAGTVTLNGNVTLGNATADDITITGSLAATIPIKTTYSYDIGSSSIGLRSIYLGSSDSAARGTRVIGATVASGWTLTLPTSGGTSGYVLTTDGSGTTSWTSNPAARNFIINSQGAYWQRGTSTTIANAAGSYQADRFYAWNSLGSGGVLTYAKANPTTKGSIYAFDVHVSTAPSAGVAYGINFAQTIDNPTSMQLYNQTASLSMLIKAQGNVTQVTIAIGYVTSEAKHGITSGLPTTLISSQTVTVSTGGFTLGTLQGVSMGTSVTTSGTYFIVCYASGVSSGNISDLNNGFTIEQPMLNIGATVANWTPAGVTIAHELAMCQHYYSQSGPPTVGTAGVPINSATGALVVCTGGYAAGGNAYCNGYSYPVVMRTAPTLTIYDIAASPASGKCTLASGGGSFADNSTAPTLETNRQGFSFNGGASGSGTSPLILKLQWKAEGDI